MKCGGKAKQSNAKKQKKQTDPNAPKRAKSGYNIFTVECGTKKEELFGTPEEIKEKGGYMKCVSLAWKELSEQEKEKYTEMAEKDKERYERQMEQYEREGKFDEEEEGEKQQKQEKKGGKKGKKKQEEQEEEEEEEQENKKKNKKKSNKRMCGE